MTDFLALTQPCPDCPFRRDSPIRLRRGRREEIARALRAGDTFFCHKTVDYSGDDPDTTDAARCYGAASVTFKTTGTVSQNEQIATRLGLGTPDTARYETTATYASLDHFQNAD